MHRHHLVTVLHRHLYVVEEIARVEQLEEDCSGNPLQLLHPNPLIRYLKQLGAQLTIQ